MPEENESVALDNSVPSESGETEGTQTEQAEPVTDDVSSSVDENSQEESAQADENVPPTSGQTEQAATPKYGSFGNDPEKLYEGYRALESKLGNYKEVEAKAQAYEKLAPLLENPALQQALAPKQEQEPDMSQWSPEQIIDYRADKRAQAIVDARLKEVESKFMPFVEDYNNERATKEINEIAQKYPDFKDYAAQIKQAMDTIPLPPGEAWDKNKIEFYYKALSYDKATKLGEQNAYKKLQSKQQLSRTAKPSNAQTVKRQAQTFEEAFAQAKEGK